MLCAHQAGNAAIRTKLEPGDACNWDLMVDLLARQEPFWKPGHRHGYHAATIGWLVGEVVRRVSGKSLGTFFREEIADPLGLEFWIGLPEELEPKVAPNVHPEGGFRLGGDAPLEIDENTPLPLLVFGNLGTTDDTRAMHAAELGGGGGIANARGIARMYRPLALGGSYDGVELVDADTLANMGRVASGGMGRVAQPLLAVHVGLLQDVAVADHPVGGVVRAPRRRRLDRLRRPVDAACRSGTSRTRWTCSSTPAAPRASSTPRTAAPATAPAPPAPGPADRGPLKEGRCAR